MNPPIYSPTEEEKKEARETANSILGYLHELPDKEKAFLLHVLIKKFEKLTGIKAEDLIKEDSFKENKDEKNKS